MCGWTILFIFFSPWEREPSRRKPTSNRPFAWYQFTLTTGACWAFTGNPSNMWICTYPLGSGPAQFLFHLLSDGREWILKHNYGLQHVIHILVDFLTAERTKLSCLSSSRSWCRSEPLYHTAFINDPLREEVLTYAKNTNRAYSCGKSVS